jgi:hypothetical protein
VSEHLKNAVKAMVTAEWRDLGGVADERLENALRAALPHLVRALTDTAFELARGDEAAEAIMGAHGEPWDYLERAAKRLTEGK